MEEAILTRPDRETPQADSAAPAEQLLREALAEDRIEVFYQPIYDVGTGTFTAAEALCRLRLRDGTLLTPDRFIPIAEATGLIAALGERVFTKVCRFLRDAAPGGLARMGANLSPLQCGDPTLADRYGMIAARYGIDPRRITLELTETVGGEKTVLMETLCALRKRGFDLALDDFGRGASNLLCAVELPVSSLKLDMELTRLFFTDPRARSVVKAIVTMARELKLCVVFEGVETAAQAAEVMAAGADYIQGFYYARPLAEGDFLAFLRAPDQNSIF